MDYSTEGATFQISTKNSITSKVKFISKHFKIIKKEYYINPSAKGSRSEWLGTLLTKVPDSVWEKLAKMFPGLFARGVILLCKNIEKSKEVNPPK